jgi:hypothetical protein
VTSLGFALSWATALRLVESNTETIKSVVACMVDFLLIRLFAERIMLSSGQNYSSAAVCCSILL